MVPHSRRRSAAKLDYSGTRRHLDISGTELSHAMADISCLLHNGHVVSQVVVHKMRSSEPVFEALSNGSAVPPLSFEDTTNDVYVPRLGSDDLLYIAAFALSSGYLLDGIYVVGRHGAPLEEEQLERASAELVENLRSGAAYAATIFARNYPGHFVAGIVLTSPEMHTLILRRLGVVETDSPSLATDFLTSAWKKVHFA